jgi:hypothetical protein
VNSDNRLSGTFCFLILYGLMVEILNFKNGTTIIKLTSMVTNFNFILLPINLSRLPRRVFIFKVSTFFYVLCVCVIHFLYLCSLIYLQISYVSLLISFFALVHVPAPYVNVGIILYLWLLLQL